MIKELKQKLNNEDYTVKISNSWMEVKQDKEVGSVSIVYWKSDKTIRVESYTDLEVLEMAIQLFKELDNGSDD
jgi:hypothetical protein